MIFQPPARSTSRQHQQAKTAVNMTSDRVEKVSQTVFWQRAAPSCCYDSDLGIERTVLPRVPLDMIIACGKLKKRKPFLPPSGTL
jgi:hypothetical protein